MAKLNSKAADYIFTIGAAIFVITGIFTNYDTYQATKRETRIIDSMRVEFTKSQKRSDSLDNEIFELQDSIIRSIGNGIN